MVYGPIQYVDADCNPVYAKMHLADSSQARYNWDPQEATGIALICLFDEMQHVDIWGDRNACLMYLTIRSIHSTIPNKFSYFFHNVLSFLQMPPNFHGYSTTANQAQRDIIQQLLSDIAKILVEPVTWLHKEGVINSSATCLFFAESLGECGGCQTRNLGWLKHKVDWTKAAAFRCTWEQWQRLWVDIGALVTTRGTSGSTDNMPESANNKPSRAGNNLCASVTSLGAPQITSEQTGKYNIICGNTTVAPRNHSYYLWYNDL